MHSVHDRCLLFYPPLSLSNHIMCVCSVSRYKKTQVKVNLSFQLLVSCSILLTKKGLFHQRPHPFSGRRVLLCCSVDNTSAWGFSSSFPLSLLVLVKTKWSKIFEKYVYVPQHTHTTNKLPFSLFCYFMLILL